MTTLCVTAMGLVTSVGRDAATSCASIRAGITRPAAIEGFEVLDVDRQVSVALTGHPIAGVTDGFTIVALWRRITDTCLSSFFSTNALPPRQDTRYWSETGLFLVTPAARDRRFDTENSEAVELGPEVFLEPLLQSLELPIDRRHAHHVAAGRIGLVHALQRLHSAFESGTLQRALIVAVDSYLDPITLHWLDALGRLKSDSNPIGLSPGEAGACLLIETRESAELRNTHVLSVICGFGVGRDHSIYADLPNDGSGLAEAIQQCLMDSSLPDTFAGELISDHNGEQWRASQLGAAYARLGPGVLAPTKQIYPAVSTGDTGSASSSIAVAVATASFQRGYASAPYSLALISDELGQAAAVCLAAP